MPASENARRLCCFVGRLMRRPLLAFTCARHPSPPDTPKGCPASMRAARSVFGSRRRPPSPLSGKECRRPRLPACQGTLPPPAAAHPTSPDPGLAPRLPFRPGRPRPQGGRPSRSPQSLPHSPTPVKGRPNIGTLGRSLRLCPFRGQARYATECLDAMSSGHCHSVCTPSSALNAGNGLRHRRVPTTIALLCTMVPESGSST